MDSSTSGFFSPVEDYGQPDLTSFTPIPTSQGSICKLYRGERAGRFRVYKCLKPEFRGSLLHEGILRKEFEMGYSLRHPGICEVYSFMTIEGLGSCIEMEWIDGITLDEYLKRGLPDERTFRRIAAQLCDALGYIHSRQMVHRDLKPSNIMVSHDGLTVKLIDFGLADDAASTVLKAPAGTLWWVAPEVLEGRLADVRSDIYSLGAVLGTMTKGHRRCIGRCTAEDPRRRYGSAGEVKEVLEANSRPWMTVIICAVILTIAAIALFFKRQAPVQGAQEPVAPGQKPFPDTVYVLPQQSATPEAKPLPAGRGSIPRDDREDNIDEIFEKASELFEENL